MSINLDLNTSPYYDDFDPSKKYIQLLALPGRAEQAREFTQLQTIMLYLMRKLAATILKEGTIISGMSFTKETTNLTITPGQVYLEGIVHDFDGQTITVSNGGIENIGITLNKVIVTEEDDISLRDPAQGYENHGLPGSHRIQAIPVLTRNDSTAPVLYKFVDGTLQIDPIRADANADLLARRTFDESGNYKVFGLDLWCQSRDDITVTLNVDSGKAYILGYEISKSSSVKVVLDRATDTRLVQNEPKVFHTSTSTYLLNNTPVNTVTRVSATVQVSQTVTRGGSVGGQDLLPKSPVVQIVSVIQGGTTYTQGTDYQLVADSVDWSLSGVEPSIGTSYTVVWQYNKIMVLTTDYLVTYVNNSGVLSYYIDFSPAGDNPVDTTTFYVDYTFYMARKDLISLNRFGDIVVTKGQSNIPLFVNAPSISDPELLHLGTVYMAPNAAVGVANTYAITRLSMEDLQRIATRVEQIEYNQALTDLDRQAMSGQSPTTLKGILTDGFLGLSKADINHPSFNISFAFEEGALKLPPSSIKVNTPSINVGNSTTKTWGRLLTSMFTEAVATEQTYATGRMLVNPYSVFNQSATIKLTPEVDNWIDTTNITVENQTTSINVVHRWWYHGGDLWSETERYLFNNLKLDAGQSWTGWDSVSGTTTSSTSRTILDESIQFIRQRVVSIECFNLIANTDNLEVYFDGQKVIATPGAGSSAGTAVGTLKANSSGHVIGSFTIPANIRTGTREVSISNANNVAVAPYTASGRDRVVETNVLHTKVTVLPYDPLAQSFMFTKDQIVSSVGLYFSAKGTSNVIVQIRNTVNGYPGQIVYGEEVLAASVVNISSDGSLETKVSFADPIYCKSNTQYCVVVITDSAVTEMFIAELSKVDLVSGSFVSRQPYVQGTLFSSSNALTWTAHQTSDLKFRVYSCTFASSGVVEFDPITSLNVDRIVMFSEYLTPQSTGCKWEMKLNAGSYEPMENYKDVSPGLVVDSIQLRCTFTSNVDTSPIVSLDTLNIIGFLSSTSGSYISKNAVLSQNFTIVKQIFEAYIPAGCTVTPQFATDTTGTVWISPSSVVTEAVDGYYTRYTYTYTLGASATNFRSRLNMTSPSQIGRPKARKFMNIIS